MSPDDPSIETHTVIAPVERRTVARGSKSEREATVAIIDGRPLVLRRRGASAFDDGPAFAALAGRTVRLTGTALSTAFVVDDAAPLD